MKKVAIAAFLLLSAATAARADERHFTYSYEARTLPHGSWELEQWFTVRTEKEEGSFTALDLRSEIEYGITDRLTASVYLNFLYYAQDNVPGRLDGYEFKFDSVSTEWKYKFSDPSADLVGTLGYVEVLFSDDEYELEFKAVLSKDVGFLHFAYNLVFEIEWLKSQTVSGGSIESDYTNKYLLSNTFGVSLQPWTWGAVGVEALIESRYVDDFSNHDFSAMFIGPNVHVATEHWWATLTFLLQTDVFSGGLELDAREKYQVRLIFGVSF